jgi:hypothetical protein
MTATLPRLGASQINVLRSLKDAPTGLTAPFVRDSADLGDGDYGTRRAISVLDRLTELGFVAKEVMSEKVALNNLHPETGRKSKHRFKINADGKKALKALS